MSLPYNNLIPSHHKQGRKVMLMWFETSLVQNISSHVSDAHQTKQIMDEETHREGGME